MTKPWIHASTAHQLLQCPKRWVAGAAPQAASAQAPTAPVHFDGAATLGTLIHSTVEQWINSGQWADPDNDRLAANGFRAAAATLDAPIGPTRILAASLHVQLGALRILLSGQISDAEAEAQFSDDDNRIRGRIDILCRGADHPTVVDIKSGKIRTRDGQLMDEITTQMAVYCWLLRSSGEPWPAVLIASLKDGVCEVTVTPEMVQQRIAALLEARDAALNDPVAIPGQQTCRFCILRPTCEPQWAAVAEGLITDAVGGVITRVEQGPGGRLMIAFIADDEDEPSILRIAHNTVIDGPLRAGDRLRAVRVAKDADRPRWTARGDALVCTSLAQ